MGVLRTVSGNPFQNLYCANINAWLLHVVNANPAAAGQVVGGWEYPDFGCSALTARVISESLAGGVGVGKDAEGHVQTE